MLARSHLLLLLTKLYYYRYSLRFHDNKIPEVHEKHDDTSPGGKLIGFQSSLRFLVWLALWINYVKYVVTISVEIIILIDE